MQLEAERYQNRIATVVGGRGALGSTVAKGLENLGFGKVPICEDGDPFRDFVGQSTDIFFAVDGDKAVEMLRSARDLLQPHQTILDGASVKTPPLITLYRELDGIGISVASTHYGAVPEQPPRGIKVWVCEIGPNSERAKRLAFDLYLSKNSSVRAISIDQHPKIEQAQWFAHATSHVFARALKEGSFPLAEIDAFATLNTELALLALGRTLGQAKRNVRTPSEILYTQPRRHEFFAGLKLAVEEFERRLDNREELETFLTENVDFHDELAGIVDAFFVRGGFMGARLTNLRMHSLSFRIVDDRPGRLLEILPAFYEEGANLTAIDSMSGTITPQETEQGIDPDKIVDFAVGIDPKTINPEKEARIKEKLSEMGCVIS